MWQAKIPACTRNMSEMKDWLDKLKKDQARDFFSFSGQIEGLNSKLDQFEAELREGK